MDTPHDPWRTVRAIDAALRKAEADRLPDITVNLSWNRYKDLLDIKGIAWEPVDHKYWATHDGRPLTMYRRRYPLRLLELNNPNSAVLGHLPDGTINGWAVVLAG